MMTESIPDRPPDFRDIRPDLRARIKSLEHASEREQAEFQRKQEMAAAEHRKVMESIKKAVDGYRRLLDLEEAMAEKNMLDTGDLVGPVRSDGKMPLPVSRASLPDFFITKLREKGPLTKEELRIAALFAGYFADGDSGGRATHATLSNISRSGRIGVTEGGKYFAVQTQEKPML
jgi:hypothetical protein